MQRSKMVTLTFFLVLLVVTICLYIVVPEKKPNVPKKKPDVPEKKPDVPEKKPDVPEKKPDVPEKKPDVPEKKPDQGYISEVYREYNVLAYNVKAGRLDESCCWTKDLHGKNVENFPNEKAIANKQMDWLKNQMKLENEEKLDFVLLSEAKNPSHGLQNQCAPKELLEVEGWDFDADNAGTLFGCGVVYWRKNEWVKISADVGHFQSTEDRGWEGSPPGRVFNNVALYNKKQDQGVIVSSIQMPHPDTNTEKFVKSLAELTDFIEVGQKQPIDIIFGGDFNIPKIKIERIFQNSLNPNVSEDLGTCCHSVGFETNQFDHIAISQYDQETRTFMHSVEQRFTIEASTITQLQESPKLRTGLKWKTDFTPKPDSTPKSWIPFSNFGFSSEHYPVFAKIKAM